MAMVLSFIWIVLMRWIAGVMVWVTLVLFVGIFGFGNYQHFYKIQPLLIALCQMFLVR